MIIIIITPNTRRPLRELSFPLDDQVEQWARQTRMRCSRSVVKVALGCTMVKLYWIQTSGAWPRTTKSEGSASTVTVGQIGSLSGTDVGSATYGYPRRG